MNDKSIREILISWLQATNHEIRIYQEKSIGASICDVMAVTDKLTGYEIKSDQDNYARLQDPVIGFDLILDSVDALIQSFSQFHGADFFINEFIMQFMSSALVKIHSSSSLSYSITRGTLKPPLWTAGAFFSASS